MGAVQAIDIDQEGVKLTAVIDQLTRAAERLTEASGLNLGRDLRHAEARAKRAETLRAVAEAERREDGWTRIVANDWRDIARAMADLRRANENYDPDGVADAARRLDRVFDDMLADWRSFA